MSEVLKPWSTPGGPSAAAEPSDLGIKWIMDETTSLWASGFSRSWARAGGSSLCVGAWKAGRLILLAKGVDSRFAGPCPSGYDIVLPPQSSRELLLVDGERWRLEGEGCAVPSPGRVAKDEVKAYRAIDVTGRNSQFASLKRRVCCQTDRSYLVFTR
jgi:hypothetical protein